MAENEIEIISERKRKILLNSVEDYIQSAVPITSRDIQQNHLKDISTATLRNELNALEAMGYLKQLHTSSGRVPTSKAYRFYVDDLLNGTKIEKKDLSEVESSFHLRCNNLSSIIESVAKTISQVTNYPTVAVINDGKTFLIEDIKIIPLINHSALLLISTNGGAISNSFDISEKTTEEDCINCANLLKNNFVGSTIDVLINNISTMARDESEKLLAYREIFESVLELLKGVSAPLAKGKTKLLNLPEYAEVDKAKEIINILEDDEKVKEIISATGDGMSISIGRENENEMLKDCTVVKAPIKINETTVASVGVIGPQRLDYALVAGAIKFVVDEVNKQHLLETKLQNDNDTKGVHDVKKE